jgi:hypothetical protein
VTADHDPEGAGGRPLSEPHRSRLSPNHPGRAAILAAHAEAMARHEPGYLDPATGLFVLTAAYLLERGECCDTGCRHCPYLI